jgi:hypothetical protein
MAEANLTPHRPSPAEPDGRDSRGRFAKGNHAGRGNPLAGKVQRLRAALVAAVKPGDVRAVVVQLVAAAKGGDVQAAKLLLDRSLGPVAALDLELRISELERGIANEPEGAAYVG